MAKRSSLRTTGCGLRDLNLKHQNTHINCVGDKLKKRLIFYIVLILLVGCGRTGVVSVPFLEPKPYNIGKRDIIKLYKDDLLFFDSCKVYLEEIDTTQISYYDRGFKLNLLKSSDFEIYEEMIDWFDLEKTDKHKYKTPELFFSEEYNKNFLKGFRFGDDRYIKTEVFNKKDLELIDLETIRKELPTNPKILVELIQPENISEFCSWFKGKHKDADFVIINNGMGITLGTFDGFTPSFLYTTSSRACALRVPRTIIDLNKKIIVAYYLEQNNIYYASGIKTIKEGMITEFENVGKAFNSDF